MQATSDRNDFKGHWLYLGLSLLWLVSLFWGLTGDMTLKQTCVFRDLPTSVLLFLDLMNQERLVESNLTLFPPRSLCVNRT